jgi:hypothetical protein
MSFAFARGGVLESRSEIGADVRCAARGCSGIADTRGDEVVAAIVRGVMSDEARVIRRSRRGKTGSETGSITGQ